MPCSCFPWQGIADFSALKLNRYLSKYPEPRERYANERFFSHCMAAYLETTPPYSDQLEFVHFESGYKKANAGGRGHKKVDLHFSLKQPEAEEHWIELKTGPGVGNRFYKTNLREWSGIWHREIEKMKDVPVAGAKKHIISFVLANDQIDPGKYHQFFHDSEGQISWVNQANVQWKLNTLEALNILRVGVICVHS